MTTGRINQVSTLREQAQGAGGAAPKATHLSTLARSRDEHEATRPKPADAGAAAGFSQWVSMQHEKRMV